VFHPEGIEDLAVYEGDRLVEVCQVKALDEPLSLSDLQPSRDDSFFGRALQRGPDETAPLRVISFGPVGLELAAASSGDAGARRVLVEKLVGKGFQREAAGWLIGRLDVEKVNELDLKQDLVDRFRSSLLGTDPDAAFDLLSFWIYLRSEERARLTVVDAKARVETVASALAAIGARRLEWFTTIEPLTSTVLDESRRTKLEDEFFRGIAVRYEHVAAGLAVPRLRQLRRIDDGFSRNRVVVVHAASGQGKTTLAYSYLRNLPESWRFRVKAIENRHHALTIAKALLGHAHAVGVPLYVYVDVSPRDMEWAVLAAELSADPLMRVLVTIREEDWRRTQNVSQFEPSEIALTLDEEDARQIYDRLRDAHRDVPPTFDEAWSAFRGEGPLLEFTYFLTQGVLLRNRLAQQVGRIQDEVRSGAAHPNELRLLRLVSLAGAYDAKVSIRPLVKALCLPDPKRSLELLENEYLIRRIEEGQFVGGLHPVRSEILTSLLCDSAFDSWAENASAVLPLLDESDIGNFLLHALALRPHGEREQLLTAVAQLQPSTWFGFGGVARALVWRGIADYAEACKPLIDEAESLASGIWWLLLDSDVANASPGLTDSVWTVLGTLNKAGPINAEVSKDFRRRQPPKDDIWKLLRAWLAAARKAPSLPAADRDWKALGESLVLGDRASHRLPLRDWVPIEHLVTSANKAAIDALAALSFGIATASDLGPDWFVRVRQEVLDRFRREFAIVRLNDADGDLSIDFIFAKRENARDSNDELSGEAFFNSEAVRRIEVLRLLIPDRLQYRTQGWGHRFMGLKCDGTTKNIPIKNLPPALLTKFNATFQGYVALWSRPPSWKDYRQRLRAKREKNITMMNRLTAGIGTFHRRQQGLIVGDSLPSNHLEEWRRLLAEDCGVPVAAVDQWAFVGEAGASGTSEQADGRAHALRRHQEFSRCMQRFFHGLETFASQAEHALLWYAAAGRNATVGSADGLLRAMSEHGVEKRLADLAETNLHEAWQQLPEFQAKAAHYQESPSANAIEVRERRAFVSLLAVWGVFVRSPAMRVQDVCRYGMEETDRRLKTVLKSIRHALSSRRGGCTWTAVTLAEGSETSLLLTADGADASEVATAVRDGLVTASKVLQGLSGRVSTLVRLHWPRIVIVPLLRKRPLESEGIIVDTLVAASPGWAPAWWHLKPRPLDRAYLGLADLVPWDLRALDLGRSVVEVSSALLAIVNHLLDLPARIDLDDLGQEILTSHLAQVVPALRADIQAMIGAVAATEDWVAQHSTQHPSRHSRMLREELDCIRNALGRLADSEVCVGDLPELAACVTAMQQLSASAYLALVSDAVGRASKGSTA
jgi:hypothetical protein